MLILGWILFNHRCVCRFLWNLHPLLDIQIKWYNENCSHKYNLQWLVESPMPSLDYRLVTEFPINLPANKKELLSMVTLSLKLNVSLEMLNFYYAYILKIWISWNAYQKILIKHVTYIDFALLYVGYSVAPSGIFFLQGIEVHQGRSRRRRPSEAEEGIKNFPTKQWKITILDKNFSIIDNYCWKFGNFQNMLKIFSNFSLKFAKILKFKNYACIRGSRVWTPMLANYKKPIEKSRDTCNPLENSLNYEKNGISEANTIKH